MKILWTSPTTTSHLIPLPGTKLSAKLSSVSQSKKSSLTLTLKDSSLNPRKSMVRVTSVIPRLDCRLTLALCGSAQSWWAENKSQWTLFMILVPIGLLFLEAIAPTAMAPHMNISKESLPLAVSLSAITAPLPLPAASTGTKCALISALALENSNILAFWLRKDLTPQLKASWEWVRTSLLQCKAKLSLKLVLLW